MLRQKERLEAQQRDLETLIARECRDFEQWTSQTDSHPILDAEVNSRAAWEAAVSEWKARIESLECELEQILRDIEGLKRDLRAMEKP
jgi:predicted RNase H-like nuclease (RuvC/YqgF family)